MRASSKGPAAKSRIGLLRISHEDPSLHGEVEPGFAVTCWSGVHEKSSNISLLSNVFIFFLQNEGAINKCTELPAQLRSMRTALAFCRLAPFRTQVFEQPTKYLYKMVDLGQAGRTNTQTAK